MTTLIYRYWSWLAWPLATKALPDTDAGLTADDAAISTLTKQIKFAQSGLLNGGMDLLKQIKCFRTFYLFNSQPTCMDLPGWRVARTGQWFLKRVEMKGWMAHPYKQVHLPPCVDEL